MTQPQAEFLELYKAGLKTAADLLKTSLQGAEKLQNQQLAAIRTALDQQSKTIGELGQARTIDEILALQTRLAGAHWARAVGYWNELYQTQFTQAQSWMHELGEAQSAVASASMRAVPRQDQQRQEHRPDQHRKSA